MKKSLLIFVALFICVTSSTALSSSGAAGPSFKPTRTLVIVKPSNSVATLLPGEKLLIQKWIGAANSGDKLTCSWLVAAKSTSAERSWSNWKAEFACQEAKRLFPSISAVVSRSKSTTAKGTAEVRLSYQALKVPSTATPSPNATFAPGPRPTLMPDTPGVATQAQKDYWRSLIASYQFKISEIGRTLVDLDRRLVIEQSKLDSAVKFNDTLRKGIQESAIAALRSESESWLSDIRFYTSLIASYQQRIDRVSPVVTSPQPTQAQIDSWNRQITIQESSISIYNSRVASIQTDLRKYVYWRSVAERYGDGNRVVELDAMIASANAEISTYGSKINEANSIIQELRRKISG